MPGACCSTGRVHSRSAGRAGNASYRFHQPDFERVLRQGRRALAICGPCSCGPKRLRLEQECDGVMVRYEDLATGSLLRCQARYVVGCDGRAPLWCAA